jgi:hypothetical protein
VIPSPLQIAELKALEGSVGDRRPYRRSNYHSGNLLHTKSCQRVELGGTAAGDVASK